MKPALFSAALLALFAAATTGQVRALALPKMPLAGTAPTDTIVVRLPNKAIMTLVVRDAAQLRQLPQYHLDSLVARLGPYIKRADEAAKTATTDRVTTQFFPNQDAPGQSLPEEIRITTHRASGTGLGSSNRVEVLLDKDKTADAGSKRSRKVNITIGGGSQAARDSMREARNDRKSSSTNFIFDLGLNALVNNHIDRVMPAGQVPTSPLDLRTGGSRYVNLGFNFKQRLGARRSPLYLMVGPELAFNNYMLEGNYKWMNQNGLTSVVPESSSRQYQKTKLATSTLTVPLMLQLNTHGSSHFHLGAGGFVGYRLASWTKLKYFEEGTTYKDKDYGSYNLNDWQYGLQGIIGFKSLTFFAKYNLNPLFRDGQGLQAQTLSFGLRLFQ
ncbi:porin family protein [Hymenobacter sp. H14-R3]|uniref:porin family protein n=1 Tax=Hymenobacter sp. H14-R3 TaxID=3046308 RepID=UPI0024B9A742|nr:porin family protein [Hymenobacter sp. H14-R3]MDJ0366655.1 porin family protein [Hymenobacter sp. H14-R3]